MSEEFQCAYCRTMTQRSDWNCCTDFEATHSQEELQVCSQQLLDDEYRALQNRCRMCGEDSNGAPYCFGCSGEAMEQGLL